VAESRIGSLSGPPGGPPGGRVPVLAHLSGFSDLMIPALSATIPEAAFVEVTPGTAPSTSSDILVTLLSDRPSLEQVVAGVRWIHVLGAGVDGFPLDLVGDRILTCSRGASAAPIAEFVLTSMLAFEKRLPDTWITAPPARWNTANLGGLRGRTLGLIGLGAIGTEVARRALAFDMEVLAARRDPGKAAPSGVQVVSLDQVLGQADHLVVTAASTAATRHLLDPAALRKVKPGVHVVNVARGALVDQQALLEALDDGRVAAASLDVVDPEPLPEGHPFYDHPRVRLTPHVSWSSPDTGQRTVEIFADNFRRWRSGQPLTGAVDLRAGY
jgi:phosphoglycerate dehydrogenase-like enzyme